jgi:hypothetical protein
MTSIHTESQFQDALDGALAWRLKEISDIKMLVRTQGRLRAESAVRAGIPIIYAHWEGFIKRSSIIYLEYINGQRLKYDELKSCFVALGMKRHINHLVVSNSMEALTEALEFLRSGLSDRATVKASSAIRTESNLSSKIFSNIAKSIGLDTKWYEPKYKLIDESLLHRRNTIAHGEFLDVDSAGFLALADEVVSLLRAFKTDIQNAVAIKAYRNAA